MPLTPSASSTPPLAHTSVFFRFSLVRCWYELCHGASTPTAPVYSSLYFIYMCRYARRVLSQDMVVSSFPAAQMLIRRDRPCTLSLSLCFCLNISVVAQSSSSSILRAFSEFA
jgi:hypothetical protein